jgi:hypothetical protein
MRALTALVLVLCLAAPMPIGAWGFDIHRFIVQEAIPLLPDAIRPFYEKYRTTVIEHSIDPDLWRSAGFEEEPPRHFVDLDAFGPPPFDALPRDYDTAVKRFGKEMVDKNGLLPWRAAEMYGQLVRAFQRVAQGQPYGYDDLKFFSAVLAHYVSDAHVPFHAIMNYDGQLTNQRGIHGRFESELFLRYRSGLSIRPAARAPIRNVRDFVFDTLVVSAGLTDQILQADRKAVSGREAYDDAYFEAFVGLVKPTLERRLSASASAVAAVITGAWEEAGKPALPLDPPRAVRKVGR